MSKMYLHYDNLLVFNKKELVFLVVCALIVDEYKERDIKKITYGDLRIFVFFEDSPSEFKDATELIISAYNRLKGNDLLYNCINLLINVITENNIHIFVDFLKSIKLETYSFPDQLFKYVSNKSDCCHKYFKNYLTFVHRDYFDDIYDSDILDDLLFDKKKLKDRLRILCLSTSYSNNALWGLYANKFNGFCFQHDRDDILESVRNNYKSKNIILICEDWVHYKKNDSSLILCEIYNNDLKKVINAIKSEVFKCFYKEKSWSFEKEYRFIVLGNFDEKDFLEMPTNYTSYFWYNLDDKKICASFNMDDFYYQRFIKSVGVWFLLSYLTKRVLKEENETSYLSRTDYERWTSYIDSVCYDDRTILELLDYIKNNCLSKETKNAGNVSLKKQKQLLEKLISHSKNQINTRI